MADPPTLLRRRRVHIPGRRLLVLSLATLLAGALLAAASPHRARRLLETSSAASSNLIEPTSRLLEPQVRRPGAYHAVTRPQDLALLPSLPGEWHDQFVDERCAPPLCDWFCVPQTLPKGH